MTHNWSTLTPMPKATNDFGQPIMQDYGDDDLFPIIVDFHGAPDPASMDRLDLDIARILGEDTGKQQHLTDAQMMAQILTPVRTASEKRTARIVALLDDDEPAMLTPDTDVKADFYDGGMAWWIGADATIGCPVEMEPNVASIAERGGWQARSGNYPASCGFVVVPHGDEDMAVGPLSKHNEQYHLWRMVQDTLLVDA